MSSAWRMRALCLAGRIILENGGETYRAEETVIRMAQALGLCEVDVFGIPSGLFISYTDEAGERETSVCRVFLRGTHLKRVDRVNRISRGLADGTVSPDMLWQALQQAERLDEDKGRWYAPLMAFVTTAGFAVMFGGGPIDMLIGGLSAVMTIVLSHLLRRDSGGSMSVLLGGMVCALVPLAFTALTGLGVPEAMIAAALMPLVPGLSMTNAVQDILRGDMVSGVAHCARAIMVAALLAGGALVGMHVCTLLGFPVTNAAIQAWQLPLWLEGIVVFLSSLVAAAGFGALLYAPRKAVLWGGMLGAIGYLSYWGVVEAGVAETVAMFVGALVASAGAQVAARKLKMIATVFVTIAILPLVPGLGLYRAMSALAAGQLAGGAGIAAQTMASILMMALGIGLGSALFGAGRRLEH